MLGSGLCVWHRLRSVWTLKESVEAVVFFFWFLFVESNRVNFWSCECPILKSTTTMVRGLLNKLVSRSLSVAGKWQHNQLRCLNIHEYQVSLSLSLSPLWILLRFTNQFQFAIYSSRWIWILLQASRNLFLSLYIPLAESGLCFLIFLFIFRMIINRFCGWWIWSSLNV